MDYNKNLLYEIVSISKNKSWPNLKSKKWTICCLIQIRKKWYWFFIICNRHCLSAKNVCYCDLVMDSLRFFSTNLNINKWWCFFCCLVLHKVFIGAISFIELKSVSILLSSLQSHDIQMEPSRYYKASILKSRNGKLLVKRILARVMSVRNGKRFVPVGSRNISIYHLFVVYTNLSNIISWKFIVCLRANKNGKRA